MVRRSSRWHVERISRVSELKTWKSISVERMSPHLPGGESTVKSSQVRGEEPKQRGADDVLARTDGGGCSCRS